MRAITYSRVSTEDQAENGFSLQDQTDRMRAFCAERQIEVIDAISDDMTGKIITRPGLQQISVLAEQRAFDVLVCVRLDRLARLSHLRRTYEEFLHKHGISVLYVEQSFEPTPAGRLQRGIMGELAEYESELIRERTTRGRIRKATDAGRIPVNCRTFGYHQITVAESRVIPEYLENSGSLVIVEEEAALVRRMFRMHAGGMTLDEIAAIFRREGAKTRMGGLWWPGTMRSMLRNETYAGRLYYNRVESVRTGGVAEGGSLQITRTLRNRSDWILLPVPAIIDEALFQAVQKRLDYNRERLRGPRTNNWLLHGVVICKKCLGRNGKSLSCVGIWGWNKPRSVTYRYYRCTSRWRHDITPCRTTERADFLEQLAVDVLRGLTPVSLAKIGRQRVQREAKKDRPEDELKRLEAALESLETEEGRLADLVLAGMSHTVISGKVEEIHRRRRLLMQDLAQARSRAQSNSPDEAARRGERAGEYLRESLKNAGGDREELARLIRLFLEIRIYRGEVPDIIVRVPRLE